MSGSGYRLVQVWEFPPDPSVPFFEVVLLPSQTQGKCGGNSGEAVGAMGRGEQGQADELSCMPGQRPWETSQPGGSVLFCYPITKQKRTLLVVEWRMGMGPGQSLETGMVTP